VRSVGDEGGSGGKSSVGVVLLVLLILIVAGAAAGYWYWQQTRPAAAVSLFMQSVNDKKWDAVYDQIELPSQAKQMVSKDMFVSVMGMVGAKLKVESYTISGTKIDGDTAKVTVASTVSVGEKRSTSTGDLSLKKVDGVWKIDATSGAPSVPGMSVPNLPGLK